MVGRPRITWQLALSAALAARRPKLVRHLLSSKGHHACALVVATWLIRQIADVLSTLPRAQKYKSSCACPSAPALSSPKLAYMT